MKRLSLLFLLVLLLAGCGKVEQPEFQPTSGVQMDLSKLEAYTPVEEICPRRFEERTEELIPDDYGLLRPYVGSRVAFDMTIYGNDGIYNGHFGLVDETGAIVVDPVYTDVRLLTQWDSQEAPKLWRLAKQTEKDGYMEQVYGFCSLDGTVAEPCIYENIAYQNGYIIACNGAKDGLLRVFDSDGKLLLDTETWAQRFPIYSEMGYSSVEVSENLLFIGVIDQTAEYGMAWWLCDWEGNILSKHYDFVTLSGEPPYACGNWGGVSGGYLDEYGKLLRGGYETASAYHFGQALVRRNGQEQVIDTEGNVLWAPNGAYCYTCLSDTTVYYQIPYDDGMETGSFLYYNKDFEQMYPEADHVSWMLDDWFLVWKDGNITLTDGTRSAVLEDAVMGNVDFYYGNDIGAEDMILITTWEDSEQFWWVFDDQLNLMAKGVGESSYTEVMPDRLGGSSVAVAYERMSYPAKYTVLDYDGAPTLKGVNILDVYGGWYMVEDTFSTGYMDKDGNWLFRVSLMEDMTD